MRPEIRLDFRRGFVAGAGEEEPAADAVHPRRRRRLRADVDGLSALRSQARRQGAVGGSGSVACQFVPRQPGGVHAPRRGVRGVPPKGWDLEVSATLNLMQNGKKSDILTEKDLKL